MPSFVHVSQTDSFNTWRVRTNELIDWLNAETVNNNYAAAMPPSPTDDSSAGYQVGSIWIDTSATPNEAYRCTDNTVGAAVWLNTTLEIGDLGSIVTQDANAVNITGGSISGITDLAIVDGGTGASDAPTARTNLGVYSKPEVNALVDDLSGVTNPTVARTNLNVYSKPEVDAIASSNAIALAIALGG